MESYGVARVARVWSKSPLALCAHSLLRGSCHLQTRAHDTDQLLLLFSFDNAHAHAHAHPHAQPTQQPGLTWPTKRRVPAGRPIPTTGHTAVYIICSPVFSGAQCLHIRIWSVPCIKVRPFVHTNYSTYPYIIICKVHMTSTSRLVTHASQTGMHTVNPTKYIQHTAFLHTAQHRQYSPPTAAVCPEGLPSTPIGS